MNKMERLHDIRELEIQEEDGPLTPTRLFSLRQSRLDIHEIYHKKEIMWRQRARTTWLKEGDKNTTFFHKTTNARSRSNAIHSLKVDNLSITKENFIHRHVDSHFKQLFGMSGEHQVFFSANIWGGTVNLELKKNLGRK